MWKTAYPGDTLVYLDTFTHSIAELEGENDIYHVEDEYRFFKNRTAYWKKTGRPDFSGRF